MITTSIAAATRKSKEFPHLLFSFSLELGIANRALDFKQAERYASAWELELPNYHLESSPEFNFSDIAFALAFCLDRHWELGLQVSHSFNKGFLTFLSKDAQKDSPLLVYEQQRLQFAAVLRWLLLKDIEKILNLRFSPFLQLSLGLKIRLKECFGYAILKSLEHETIFQETARHHYTYKEHYFRKNYTLDFFVGLGCGVVLEFAGLRIFGCYTQRFFLEKLYSFPALVLLDSTQEKSALFSFPAIFNYGFFQIGLAYLFNPRVNKNAEKLFKNSRRPFAQRIG